MDDRPKLFRAWNAMAGAREAVSPADVLPEDDLVFFLLDLVPRLDLSAFYKFYSEDLRGQPPFDVTMMVTLLVYSYSVGVFSSRKIAGASERNLRTDKARGEQVLSTHWNEEPENPFHADHSSEVGNESSFRTVLTPGSCRSMFSASFASSAEATSPRRTTSPLSPIATITLFKLGRLTESFVRRPSIVDWMAAEEGNL